MSKIQIDPSMVPVFRTAQVTPKDAEELLRRNTHNRAIRSEHVGSLARDMKKGQWTLNGEAIKISRDGTILDGQHRLLAVVLAGVPVWLTIVENLEPDTQYTMDLGLKRGTGDHLRLQGEADPFSLAAITRTAWQYSQDGESLNRHIKPTQAEIDTFLEQHPELRRSNEISGRCYKGFRFLTRTAYGTSHFILLSRHGADNGRIPEFFARVEDGAELTNGNPILTMRRRAMVDKANRVRLAMGDQVGYLLYTFDTWNRFLDSGTPLHRFGYQVKNSKKAGQPEGQVALPTEE